MRFDRQHGNLACCSAEPPPTSIFDPDRSATTVRLVNKRKSGTEEEITTSPLDLTEGRNNGGQGSQPSMEVRCGPVVAEGVKHRVGVMKEVLP